MERKIKDEHIPAVAQRVEAVDLTDGAKLAIVLCASAFRFGGNWGFIPKSDTLKEQLETLTEERPNVKAHKVSNGALVLSEERFLAYNVNKVLPNAINMDFVAMAKKRRQEEKEAFLKFLTNVVNGKSKYTKGQSGKYDITLGIFSVNETNVIRINGKDYPAYKLTHIEVLQFLHQLSESQGRKVLVRAVLDNGQPVYETPFKLGSNSKGIQAVFRGLELAESGTGAFLQVSIF